MKLLLKTSIYSLIASLAVFALGGIVFYFLVMIEINKEIDDVLTFQKDKIIEHIVTEKMLPDFNTIYDVKVKISPAIEESKKTLLKDTVLYNELKKEYITYRMLVFYYKVDNKIVRIQLLKSFFEIEDLIKGILVFILLLLVFLLVTLLSVNFFISKLTFKPFYKILKKLEGFDVTKNIPIEIENQTTYEFEKLRNTLQIVTGKTREDYVQQKEFIEHASHELQTPLAIIKMKCELLLQADTLTDDQANSVLAVSEAANRLSKINHALLLITKIENKQFHDNENIDVEKHIEKHIAYFADMLLIKKINFSSQYHQKLILKMNPVLSDILISNILFNAIKHNIEGGYIKVEVADNTLLISNSGNPLDVEPSNLFKRFTKDKSKSDSLGLGLTIVKKITDLYLLEINYSYKNGIHQIVIKLPSK